jgi:hypothetical protein
LLDQLR